MKSMMLRIGVVVVAMLGGGGCSKLLSEPELVPGTYGDGDKELRRMWTDLLVAAQRDDRQKVVAMMNSMRMSPQELAMLIGEDKAKRFWPRYELLARPLMGPAAAELVASIYEHHYDDVEVVRADTLPTDSQSDSERVVTRTLVKPTPFYRVRVIRKGQPGAIRYDFFVYQHGYWRTGRELGKFLEPLAPLNPAAKPAEPGK